MTLRKMRIVILFSGGLDSTTCLYWGIKKGYDLHPLIFDYGQRHSKEVKKAVEICRLNRCSCKVVKIRLPWNAGALTDKSRKMPVRSLAQIGRSGIPDTYVPGRNTIFLSYASSYAESIGADGILFGANQLDYSGYPDCRIEFVRAFQRLANLGSSYGNSTRKLSVMTPLIRMTKTQIVLLAAKLGVPLEKTWSCYSGGKFPCGSCDSCKLRSEAFRKAKMTDPVAGITGQHGMVRT